MIFCIGDVLSGDELRSARDLLDTPDYRAGSETAGWAARDVKNNLQMKPGSNSWSALQQLVSGAINRNDVFNLAAAPKVISPLLISRYETGMGYGDHVDNAVMRGGTPLRSDLSFTVFLSSPDSYQGGELAIEDTQGVQTYKLDSGAMVLYPSSSVHRVETVTSGVREVAVGWVQSLVRESDRREVLFDLETLRRQVFARDGKTAEFNTLSKAVSNLWRMWVQL